MYILTQDKKKIVNTANVTSIGLFSDKQEFLIKAYGNTVFNSLCDCVDCDSDTLGIYSSEDMAKIVLHKMMYAFGGEYATFTMPQNNEV